MGDWSGDRGSHAVQEMFWPVGDECDSSATQWLISVEAELSHMQKDGICERVTECGVFVGRQCQ